jgi:hypothetical protein
MSAGSDIGKLLSFFFLGCIFVLVVTHSQGFATSAGSLFTTTNDLAEIFTGAKVNSTIPATAAVSGATGGTTGGTVRGATSGSRKPGIISDIGSDFGRTVSGFFHTIF